MTEAAKMRKLMESIDPVKEMGDMPIDNMGAMDNNGDMGEYAPDMGDDMGMDVAGDEMAGEAPAVSTDIIDALEGEFKRLTTDFLQTGGELDAAGLKDIREKLGKHMTSILDVLHAGWMDNMMDQGAPAEGSSEEGGDDVPAFMKGDDDSDEGESDDSDDSEEKDNDDSEEDKSEDSDKDDSEEKDDDDGDDKEDDYNFEEAHLNESLAHQMRKLQDKILKG